MTQPTQQPGQYFDQETGLNQNYFRDYDPNTGRYIQADPVGLWGGINVYLYAAGNPLSFIDRYGMTESGTQTVFGETGGLYPQLLPGKLNPYSPKNWAPNSLSNLQDARKYIGLFRFRSGLTPVSGDHFLSICRSFPSVG
jgi:RHS repeat-associated protein